MLSPIEFLMEHRKLILQQYRENDGKAKKAWQGLQKTLPQLPEAISFNTFKQYVSVFAVVADGLDKVIQTDPIAASVTQGLDKNPKRICGWNVQKSKDGYYRCYRKIAKRVYSVYIGKNLDLKKAQVRITEKEKTLGLW